MIVLVDEWLHYEETGELFPLDVVVHLFSDVDMRPVCWIDTEIEPFAASHFPDEVTCPFCKHILRFEERRLAHEKR